jgi:hypothetical protein
MADSSDDSDTDDSIGSRRSRSRSPLEQMVKLAQIFIIKINPDNSIASIAPWDGKEPGINDRLVAYGVKISDNTYDAYIPIDLKAHTILSTLKQHESNIRTASPKRDFEYMRYEQPVYPADPGSNIFCSYLYGNPLKRLPPPLPTLSFNIFGAKETVEASLLANLMKNITRSHRPGYKNKIYVLTEGSIGGAVQPCTSSCWYLVDGPDEYQIGSPYIQEVNILDTSLSEPGNTLKKYCILDRFLVDDACSYCFRREMGNYPENPSKRRKLGGGQKAGKSRRILKRRNKRKTIKRRNKRKTIKRIFKKR